MPYTLLRGQFVVRYPDIPRQGPEPDGDTVRFQPDTPGLVESLPRRSGRPAKMNARGISVRLEAVDALETHFEETHQELAGANQARDTLLTLLGFTNVKYFDDLPNKVESADQDATLGYVLSNGIDANGRMIGFVYPGASPAGDGATVFLDDQGVDGSANAALLSAGLVYPAFYGTLPATLRTHLAGTSRAARNSNSGLWSRATADPNTEAVIADLQALEQLVIWPKLFRRLVSYFAAGKTTFDDLDSWLRADPVDRDDSLYLIDPPEAGNFHDIVSAAGNRIQLTRWPEDFIIEPDPAPAGAVVLAPKFSAGDVVIVAALPDPIGQDRGAESVSLANVTEHQLDLSGWHLSDKAGRAMELSDVLPGGDVVRVKLANGPALGNSDGSLTLSDPSGTTVDQVTYKASQVRRGRTLIFGRS